MSPPADPRIPRRRGLVALAILLAGVIALVACGTEETVSGTPGYKEQTRTVDTSPFALAAASDPSSQTTLPVLPGQGAAPNTLVPPITAPTTTPPTTSTIPGPTTTTEVPRVDSSDRYCVVARSFLLAGQEFERGLLAAAEETAPGAQPFAGFEGTKVAIVSLLRQAATALQDDTDPDIAAMYRMLLVLLPAAERATDYDSLAQAVTPLRQPSDPQVVVASERITGHLQTSCPQLGSPSGEG